VTRPDLSVIVCTRNRAGFLSMCLDALAEVRFERERFEVLVVDNGSTDGTAALLERMGRAGRLPLRRTPEPVPGLARARNTGVREAAGRFLIFLDDDALVAPGWLAAYDRNFQRGEAIVQGRILPRLLGSRPAWLTEDLLERLGRTEAGSQCTVWTGPLRGGNMGVARRVFEAVGLFRTDLGAGAAGLGEDTEFGLRAAAAGFRAAYAPEALAYHLIPRRRLSRSAFLRRCYLAGLCQPLVGRFEERIFRMLASFLARSLVRLAAACAARDSGRHMAEMCRLCEHAGRVVQIMRQRLHG